MKIFFNKKNNNQVTRKIKSWHLHTSLSYSKIKRIIKITNNRNSIYTANRLFRIQWKRKTYDENNYIFMRKLILIYFIYLQINNILTHTKSVTL